MGPVRTSQIPESVPIISPPDRENSAAPSLAGTAQKLQCAQTEMSRRNLKNASNFRQLKSTMRARIRLTVPRERGMIDEDSQSFLPYRNGQAR
jgi:hypothetical protein